MIRGPLLNFVSRSCQDKESQIQVIANILADFTSGQAKWRGQCALIHKGGRQQNGKSDSVVEPVS